MKGIAPAIQALVDELKRLPGIGPKSAQRLAYYLLRRPQEDAEKLSNAILAARSSLRTCSVCHNLSDSEVCEFCSSDERSRKQICVVETAQDILSIEKTGVFGGLYHVLGGALAPLQGIGPEQLNLKTLLGRIESDGVEEIIVATNPNAEGEATALYLAKLIKPLGVSVTRLAMGLPAGSELEYTDNVTMSRAIEGRREL